MGRGNKPVTTIYETAVIEDGILKPSNDMRSHTLSEDGEIDVTDGDYYLNFTYATRACEDMVVEVYDEKPQ